MPTANLSRIWTIFKVDFVKVICPPGYSDCYVVEIALKHVSQQVSDYY